MDPQRIAVISREWLPGYEILGVIGAGGFGKVLKARQLKFDRLVAVKVFHIDASANPALAARFAAEIHALGKVHHTNIVQMYDCGRHGERMYITMEFLEGEDLNQRLQRLGRLEERVAWAIARQTAVALEHARANGVIHRDVKPANLYLIPAPSSFGLPRDIPMVKVTDFGLALTRSFVTPAEERLTAPGVVLGTPAYMAPEQYRSQGDPDHRADIYGLGATLFHALTGSPPFDGATIWEVMEQKVAHALPFDPTLSAESVALLTAMMAPDRNDRIATYEELIERIEQLPALSEPPRPSPRTCSAVPRSAVRKVRKRWIGLTAAGLIVAAAAAGVGQALLSGPPASSGRASPTDYESSGEHESLYNGDSMAGWLPSAAGGAWTTDEDEERSKVLSGTGFLRRSFAAFPEYRLTIGLDVHQAVAAEVHFALAARAPDSSRRLVARISRADGATLGTRDGDRAEFRALGDAVPFPPLHWFEGRRPYVEVRFARVEGRWTLSFNGREVGQKVDDGAPKAAEVRLYAEGGPVRVDSVVLEQLRKREGL